MNNYQKLSQLIISNLKHKSSYRLLSTSRKVQKQAYEGEGKTTVTILNREADIGLMINAFSQVGFRLNNEITILGSMALFPRCALSWDVKHVDDIHEKNLSLFHTLEPKPDILIIGTGDPLENSGLFERIYPFIKKHSINLEILPTEKACAVFNFLNSEDRSVAAALIPPQTIITQDDDLVNMKLRYSNLYGVDWSDK